MRGWDTEVEHHVTSGGEMKVVLPGGNKGGLRKVRGGKVSSAAGL